MIALYAQAICNSFVAASYSDVGCVVIAVLGQWIFLAMLIALAAQVWWTYLKLVKIFAAEPQHYSVKAIVVTWGMWKWLMIRTRATRTVIALLSLNTIPHAVVPLLWTVVSVAPNHRQYRRIHFLTWVHVYNYYTCKMITCSWPWMQYIPI